ncbi:MAG: DEAD/DEAH box helicase [bacterium]
MYSELRPEERLRALSIYVAQQAEKNKSDVPAVQRRNKIRDAFFNACLKSDSGQPLTLCDAPVGTGKTTSVMAHLLRVAYVQKLRRIFVILPFTNIIRQSADTYRKALVLPGEDPDNVVAEIHHRADFKDRESRQLTALWNAPIIVTTAVAFFETLASNWPASVRRLHNLPGSAVFLDEAHAMLPVKLLPLAWHWIKLTAQNWSCYWTLASGSLNRFWEIDEFARVAPVLLDPINILLPNEQSKMSVAETTRVIYRYKTEPMMLENVIDWLKHLDGPVLVVLNTVHTTAALAQLAAKQFGEYSVEHLSSSLCPIDRDCTLERVTKRLSNKNVCPRWFLFATSCVEAGVDISFRTGVRECASLSSLLQLAGRVNRGAEFNDSDVWTINLLKTDEHVVENPAWTVSAHILQRFFADGIEIAPDLCTKAMTKELREQGVCESLQVLQKAEDTCSFETVEKKFRVIENDAVPVVVDQPLIERINNFEEVSWRDIQRGSVQIRKNLCDKMAVQEARRYPGLFLLKGKYAYSSFLGYMEGVLRCSDIDKAGCAII